MHRSRLVLAGAALSVLATTVIAGCGGGDDSGNNGNAGDDGSYPSPPYYPEDTEDTGAAADDGGGQADATTPTDAGADATTPTDSTAPADSGADTSASDTSTTDTNVADTNPADTNVADTATSTDAGTVSIVSAVPLGALPAALALDPVAQLLYVSLQNGNAAGGIAIVDTTTATVTGTIPAPVGAGNQFTSLALDTVHGVLYAASYIYSNSKVWAFSTSTKAMVGSIDLGKAGTAWAPDAGPDGGAPDNSAAVEGLAIDAVGQKLYAEVYDDTFPPTFNAIAVIDTSKATLAVTAAIDLLDQVWPIQTNASSTLAFDSSNHLLFVSGARPAFAGGSVDVIDTTKNAFAGPQIAMPGSMTGIAAVPDFAAATTGTSLELLDPKAVSLPSGFDSTTLTVAPTDVGAAVPVRVFGYDTTSDSAQVTSYLFCGESTLAQTPVMPLPLGYGYEVGLSVSSYSAATGTGTAWITQAANFAVVDAGGLPKLDNVYQLKFTGDAVSIDGDAGCLAHDH